MHKRSFYRNKPIIICIIIAVILLLCLLGSYFYALKKTEYNDIKITDYIDNTLQYGAVAESEKETLIGFSEEKHLSPAVRGHVFERISLFYSADDTPVLYYDTIGKALYYLEKGGDIETLSNIYADLANYYYTHSEIQLAQTTIDQLYAKTTIDQLNSYQQRSYLHRLQGVFDIENGDYSSAKEHLLKSLEAVENDPGAMYYGEAYIGISEVNLARLYYNTGELDKCRELVNKYQDSELLTQEIYADVMARDFCIPYYRVALDLRIHDGDIPMVEPLIHQFMDTCEKFGYRNIELEQLTYMQENLPAASPEFNHKMDEKISECYIYINEDLYHRQAIFSDSQIDFSKQNVFEQEEEKRNAQKRLVNSIIFVLVVFVLLLFILLIYTQSNTDALTKVRNRRSLNRCVAIYKRLNRGYSAIMIDIDNFKSVNDTYGHDKGDEVLKGLGKILLAEKRDGFSPFRYGGEEFALLLNECDEKKTLYTAERIRAAMENVTFSDIDKPITISVGVAFSEDSKADVLKLADDNLYFSKHHGKNVVSYNKAGETVLYKSK